MYNINEVLDEKFKYQLNTLANVSESDIKENTRTNSISFFFENSLKANHCKIVKYHDKYILALEKVKEIPFDEPEKTLVYEQVLNKQEIKPEFERITGIYLSMLDV